MRFNQTRCAYNTRRRPSFRRSYGVNQDDVRSQLSAARQKPDGSQDRADRAEQEQQRPGQLPFACTRALGPWPWVSLAPRGPRGGGGVSAAAVLRRCPSLAREPPRAVAVAAQDDEIAPVRTRLASRPSAFGVNAIWSVPRSNAQSPISFISSELIANLDGVISEKLCLLKASRPGASRARRPTVQVLVRHRR